MHKFYLFGSCLLLCQFCVGQSVSPTVIANGGEILPGEQASLSFTIGESIIETYRTDKAVLTQGFQQTNLIITSLSDELPELQVRVFPNPTVDRIYVTLPSVGQGLSFVLVDAQGRLLTELPPSPAGTTVDIDLSARPAGVYFLRALTTVGTAAKTFKIAKIK